MPFHHKGTNWLSWSVENPSRLDTIFRRRASSPQLKPQHSVLLRHKNDLAHHMFILRKKQRDLERRLSDHVTSIKECLDKFKDDNKGRCKNNKGRRTKMVFKCSTCNEARWNKLPEIRAIAQANIIESRKSRRYNGICETLDSFASD